MQPVELIEGKSGESDLAKGTIWQVRYRWREIRGGDNE